MAANGKAEARPASTLPWVEVYRPTSLDGIVSQAHIVNTITKLIDERRLPHLLFYGPPGTGKTSTILACARRLYGPKRLSSMVLELNASDERGINVVRNQIKTFASTQQIFNSGCKLVILDEADAMTSDAQMALRRVIEQYSRTTRFCLIANYTNKIIPALQSRCTKFRFAPLSPEDCRAQLQRVAEAERVEMTSDGADAIVELSGGDMRKILNTLQTVHASSGRVTPQTVHSCTGTPSPEDIEFTLNQLLNAQFKEAHANLRALLETSGLSLSDIVARLVPLVCAVEDLPAHVLAYAVSQLAQLEARLAQETSQRIQLVALVAIFHQVRHRTILHLENAGRS
ncbi:AAA+ ATPase domain-containing protein [Plasmodiophora brassicae]